MNGCDVRARPRLLITSCTRRKNPRPGKLAAWDRYQGGCFPTLKYIQSTCGLPADIDIVIISAKYGTLAPHDEIEWYDQKMTLERVKELQPSIEEKIGGLLREREYVQSLVILEELYMVCLQGVTFPQLTYLSDFSSSSLSFLTSWILQGHCDKFFIGSLEQGS